VSSERRLYLPLGILPPTTIASNKAYLVPDASLWLLGILSSTMHMTWMRAVAGRLKSDYQYSASMVFNTFPWPDLSAAQRNRIETRAQDVLDARVEQTTSTLADCYDPLCMPKKLLDAHRALDRAVDAAYGQPRGFPTEAQRLAFLFALYQQQAAPLDLAPSARKKSLAKRVK
jgi:hypothetical protein